MAESRAGLAAILRGELNGAGFRGELNDDFASRTVVSTDNSIYQIVPDAIAAPLDAADVGTLMRTMGRPPFRHIPVTARGGGTGTNGQSLNNGLIIDFQKHMHRLLDVNIEEQWADIEPGIVLAELNEKLSPHGLFFAPSTSTATRCTIGGMVSTDASGKGSRRYGKTSDNVLGLEVVLHDGTLLDSFQVPSPTVAAMLEVVASACEDGMEGFRRNVPELPRHFTGFDLAGARPDKDHLLWWRLFLGAEGTLGLVTRIRVKLRRKPSYEKLVVVGFKTIADALNAGTALIEADPLAIEVMDEYVSGLAHESGHLDRLPPTVQGSQQAPLAYNFVEFSGDDSDALESAIAKTCAMAAKLSGFHGVHVAQSSSDIAAMWAARAASVGLLGKTAGRRRPIAFVEDCVVPVANLAAFLHEFTDILKARGLRFGMYGHVDVGCLHIRPALDMDASSDRALMRQISDEVYALTKRQGGILWGEHGKGIRGQYLEDFVGVETYRAFVQIKRCFDPDDRFNPGKLVEVDRDRRGIDTTPFRLMNSTSDDPFGKAFGCNGNAQCQSFQRTVPMCPSFKATRDFRYSPKGRSDVLRAWKTAHAVGGASAELEKDVFDTLDLCLGCKACATSCPVQVDIPEMKSHFLEHYYETRRRPWADWAAIAMERYCRLLARTRFAAAPVAKRIYPLVQRLLGFVDLPPLQRGMRFSEIQMDKALAAQWNDKTVFVLQDPFNALFDRGTILALAESLRKLGYEPVILSVMPGGKSAHVLGDRKMFVRQASRLAGSLNRLAKLGRPIVAAEPAFVSMLRQEYVKGGIALEAEVLLLQEFLSARALAGDRWPELVAEPAQILVHCTEATSFDRIKKDWARVFEKLGLTVDVVPTGCCGMAGLFGHRKSNLGISSKLYELSGWRVATATRTTYATGFSCRSQVDRFGGKALHPAMSIVNARPKT